MDDVDAATGTSRRTVLRGGAMGMGALVGAFGLASGGDAAGAASPEVGADSAVAAFAKASLFLRLDGIPGDSVVKGHRADIDLSSFAYGVTNSSEVLQIVLEEILVTAYHPAVGSSATDAFSLDAAKVTLSFRPLDPKTGVPMKAITTEWDRRADPGGNLRNR